MTLKREFRQEHVSVTTVVPFAASCGRWNLTSWQNNYPLANQQKSLQKERHGKLSGSICRTYCRTVRCQFETTAKYVAPQQRITNGVCLE
jgi:hypothetical protein